MQYWATRQPGKERSSFHCKYSRKLVGNNKYGGDQYTQSQVQAAAAPCFSTGYNSAYQG